MGRERDNENKREVERENKREVEREEREDPTDLDEDFETGDEEVAIYTSTRNIDLHIIQTSVCKFDISVVACALWLVEFIRNYALFAGPPQRQGNRR